MAKDGWTKHGTGEFVQYTKGDYVINKASGSMIGGYNAYHLDASRPEGYRATMGGKAAKSLTQRDFLGAAVDHVNAHAAATGKALPPARLSAPARHHGKAGMIHPSEVTIEKVAEDRYIVHEGKPGHPDYTQHHASTLERAEYTKRKRQTVLKAVATRTANKAKANRQPTTAARSKAQVRAEVANILKTHHQADKATKEANSARLKALREELRSAP